MLGSVQDSLQVTQASRVQRRSRPSLQQLREPTDVPEWRTQIVGYRIGERLKLFVGFFELYGALVDSLFELLVEKTDLLFCPLALCNVASNRRRTDDAALRIPNWRYSQGY